MTPTPKARTLASIVKLDRLTIRDAKVTTDQSSGIAVYDVRDPHALIQAAGYVKHVLGVGRRSTVLFRGQATLYPTLAPTLFRGIALPRAQSRRASALYKLITKARTVTPMLGKLPVATVEPLFQHYGLKTSWIDVVDNVWIALWFACHRARATGKYGEYFHFERRLPRKEETEKKFAYIILIEAELLDADTSVPGLWYGKNTELSDLRVAAPSLFLRPHAQHGLLFRRRGVGDKRPVDYWPSVAGVLRVSIDDALEWLGNGALLNAHALFPPPTYDEGYRILLSDWPKLGYSSQNMIGTLAYVGT